MTKATTGARAFLILTGSELTSGEIHDRNGPFLASHLSALGLPVVEIRLVPDDEALLAQAFRDGIDRAEVVLVSGGLGPTADDRTIAVLARVLGRDVVRDPTAVAAMRARAVDRGRDLAAIPDNYYKQAEVVAGSRVLLNPVGLAPGCACEVARQSDGGGIAPVVVVLPGVPKELRGMFAELVEPLLRERLELVAPLLLRARILGLGESWAEDRLQRLGIDQVRLEYGISAKPGQLELRFLARDPGDHPYLDEVRALLEGEFGADIVFPAAGGGGVGDDAGERGHIRLVHDLLVASGRTVATAESCTGGLIAERLTREPGASRYFLGSIVAYQNDVKEHLLGVDAGLLARHGAVSAEVAGAMALAARARLGADLALAVTGIAGPDGGSEGKPVGLVFLALARGVDDVTVERQLFWGDRGNVRELTAVRALDLLRRELAGPPSP